MDENLQLSKTQKDTSEEKKPLPFGQNLLGIEFLSDDWEKDIPLEYFLDGGEENPFGDRGCNG
jgi:hypothetical protein